MRSKRPVSNTVGAGIPLGCIVFCDGFRRCRYAQMLANGWHASGMTGGREFGKMLNKWLMGPRPFQCVGLFSMASRTFADSAYSYPVHSNMAFIVDYLL